MRVSVRLRIAVAMSLILAANTGAALYARSREQWTATLEDAAQASAARARLAETASLDVARALADSGSLAFAVRNSEHSEEISLAYGWVRGSDPEVTRVIERLAASTPATRVAGIAGEWEELRRGMYAWVNEEAEQGASTFRLALHESGRIEGAVHSGVPVPASLAGLHGAELREAVRRQANTLTAGSLRRLAVEADRESASTRAAADAARRAARSGTFALVLANILLAAAAGLWLYRTISAPLVRATAFANSVASGDDSARIERHASDETGVLTRAIQDMRDALARRVEVMREMAGVVIVNADGVGDAAQHALAGFENRSEAQHHAEAVADMRAVVAQAESLKALAAQMLTS